MPGYGYSTASQPTAVQSLLNSNYAASNPTSQYQNMAESPGFNPSTLESPLPVGTDARTFGSTGEPTVIVRQPTPSYTPPAATGSYGVPLQPFQGGSQYPNLYGAPPVMVGGDYGQTSVPSDTGGGLPAWAQALIPGYNLYAAGSGLVSGISNAVPAIGRGLAAAGRTIGHVLGGLGSQQQNQQQTRDLYSNWANIANSIASSYGFGQGTAEHPAIGGDFARVGGYIGGASPFNFSGFGGQSIGRAKYLV